MNTRILVIVANKKIATNFIQSAQVDIKTHEGRVILKSATGSDGTCVSNEITLDQEIYIELIVKKDGYIDYHNRNQVINPNRKENKIEVYMEESQNLSQQPTQGNRFEFWKGFIGPQGIGPLIVGNSYGILGLVVLLLVAFIGYFGQTSNKVPSSSGSSPVISPTPTTSNTPASRSSTSAPTKESTTGNLSTNTTSTPTSSSSVPVPTQSTQDVEDCPSPVNNYSNLKPVWDVLVKEDRIDLKDIQRYCQDARSSRRYKGWIQAGSFTSKESAESSGRYLKTNLHVQVKICENNIKCTLMN